MKLVATVVIFALVCHLALGDNTTATNTTTPTHNTTNTTNTTATTNTTTNTTTPTTNTTNTTTPTHNTTTPVIRFCPNTQYFNGTGCSQCPAGCGECILNGKTVSCMTCLRTNQYLQITNGIGSCANCSVNCSSCKGPNPTDCIQPSEHVSLNPTTKTLVACNKEHCQFCNVDGTCARCSYKYQLTNGTCTACTAIGCAECPAAVSNCTKCVNGYSLNGTTCVKCADGCENCNATSCSSCAFGYDMVNGKCVQHTCTENCALCSHDANHKCTQCKPGFYLNTNGNSSTCHPCTGHCANCTATACTACLPNSDENGFHYALNNGTCNKCNDQNCLSCDGSGNCTKCYGGYFVNADKKCTACTSGCEECSVNGCTKCRSAYRHIGTGNTSNCTAFTTCKDGQQMDDKGVCTAGTIDNCHIGDATAKTCITCADGYYADGSVCSPCPVGCLSCNKDSTGYLACGIKLYTGAGFSVITNTSSKVDATGYNCRAGCATCDKQANCTSCMPNFLFTQSLISGKRFCLPYEQCPHPVDGIAPVMCWTDNKNHTQDINTPAPGTTPKTYAAKIAMSFLAVIASALFVF